MEKSKPTKRLLVCVGNVSNWQAPTLVNSLIGDRRGQIHMYEVAGTTRTLSKGSDTMTLLCHHLE